MLIDTVRQTIQTHNLIHKGDHIVLGLSGGPDSTCLFHVLQRLAPEYELTIHPVHVNHQFRPGAAERDQVYVEELCQKAAGGGTEAGGEPGIVRPCRSFIVDCNALARELRMTSEEAGRKARYDAFVQVAKEVQAELTPRVRIAVAQNANDQAETILHRILRGTGTDGLSGIAYRRFEREIPVIRPLLDVPRDEIEAYCEENGLDPVTDHTNQEPIYTRNRIRLDLLPQLTEYNQNIIETLARLGRIAAADKEYLWQQAERAFWQLRISDVEQDDAGPGDADPGAAASAQAKEQVILDREDLALQPEAIRHRVIARAFAEVGLISDISEERLRAADAIILKKQAPKTVEFPRGHSVTVARGRVSFT